jgi:tRNA (guanine37-N1)-methyltransferase
MKKVNGRGRKEEKNIRRGRVRESVSMERGKNNMKEKKKKTEVVNQKNKAEKKVLGKKQRGFDFFGNLVLVRFPDEFSNQDKIRFAKRVISENPSVKTVLEKSSKFSGRLRKMKTKHIFGEKTKEVLYKENGCFFRFNIDNTYFSPRLSNERREIVEKIKKNESVLVMFAGVAPFSIAIAKLSNPKRVVSNELNREANKYAKLNLELNKVKDKIELVSGDIKRLVKNKKFGKEKFDVIVMPRPQLKDSFLSEAFSLSKKGTRIYYYDFCKVEEQEAILKKIKEEAKLARKKIKIISKKSAGELAPYKIRIRVDFIVL